jgi:hypothetical protein
MSVENFEEKFWELQDQVRSKKLYLPEDPVTEFEEDDWDHNLLAEEISSKLDDRLEEFNLKGRHKTGDDCIGREVGDDRVDYTNNPIIAAALLVSQELIGMITSEQDTMISNESWNFCEVTTFVPTSTEQTFNKCRKRGDFRNLNYVDVPALRTIIETSKVEKVHSTSAMGKCSMLGSRLKSSNLICNSYLQVANILQDGMLRTADMPEPKYLPTVLGGCNCPDAFCDPYNTFLYMKTFKNGGYDRLYGTATAEMIEAIRLSESGQPTVPLIAQGLRGDHEIFYATMREKVFVVPDSIKYQQENNPLPTPVYEAGGVLNEIASSENRLRSAKQLVNRTSAQVMFNRKIRIEQLILGYSDIDYTLESERIKEFSRRTCFHNALRGNSAFVNLANRKGCDGDVTKLLKQGFKMCVNGQPEFKFEHAVWLSRGGKGETLSIYDLIPSEDMFIRDEISDENSLKVEGIRLNVQGNEKYIPQTTVSKVGLYQINRTMLEWAKETTHKLATYPSRPVPRGEVLRIYEEDREWVNDDTLLIQKCLRDTSHCSRNDYVFLASNDTRLANQMARQCNINVALLDPESFGQKFNVEAWNSQTLVNPKDLFDSLLSYDKEKIGYTVPKFAYFYTGAFASYFSKLEL